jgi:hypothetical protein
MHTNVLTLSHNVVSSTPRPSGFQTHNISGVIGTLPYIRSQPRWPQNGCQTTRPADNSDRDNSDRNRGLVGLYVKTTRTVLLFYNIVQYLYVYNYLT